MQSSTSCFTGKSIHTGPDPQKDCAALAAAKLVLTREKNSMQSTKQAQRVKCTQTALPSSLRPVCTCPMCMYINWGLMKNLAQSLLPMQIINAIIIINNCHLIQEGPALIATGSYSGAMPTPLRPVYSLDAISLSLLSLQSL